MTQTNDPFAIVKAKFHALPAKDQTEISNGLRWMEPALADILKTELNEQLDKAGVLGKLGEGFADGIIDSTLTKLVAEVAPA